MERDRAADVIRTLSKCLTGYHGLDKTNRDPAFRIASSHYDEIFSRPETQVATWFRVLTGTSFEDLPESECSQEKLIRRVNDRWRLAKNRLLEYTGGVASDSDSRRMWEVDPIPLLIEIADWQILSKGIAQRAKLIDLLLRDVYGPQTYVQRGLIPVELLYGTDAYLHNMRGSLREGDPVLAIYAAQLCRDPSGQWFVIADRTQGPSGGGYAVENRVALSRVLPNEFRELMVQRSAPFFAAFKQTIAKMSERGVPNSRTVLLSPGTRSVTFFEDAYLARYLGYSLAQTDDLTVRNRSVYLKTLLDLVPVSTLFRRVVDHDCDPLELATSAIGIPGLCQASRDGTIAMANPLGAGWAEMPALRALLPRLCKEILGEELLLPSWPTWWCGEPESKQYVEDHLDGMILNDAFSRQPFQKIPMAQLSNEQRASHLTRLRESPWSTVATRSIEYSTAPTWHGQRIVSWPIAMRVFATAADNEFVVLRGGIARTAEKPVKLSESLTSGTLSKDIWVLGNSPVKPLTLWKQSPRSFELKSKVLDLPSRVAEQLFWLGKWVEIAEGKVRHARCCVNRLSGEDDPELIPVLATVVNALENRVDNPFHSKSTSAFESQRIAESLRSYTYAFVFDESNHNSIAAALAGVRKNATRLRDRLSLDSWQILSRLDFSILRPNMGDTISFGDLHVLLTEILDYLTAFSGLMAENMTRGPGWQFLDMGRRIERAHDILRLIDRFIVPDFARQTSLLELLLEILDSAMTYRYRYLTSVEVQSVLDLLLIEESNPRAAAFQFVKLENHFRDLIRMKLDRDGLSRLKSKIEDHIRLFRILPIDTLSASVADVDDQPMRSELKRLTGRLYETLMEIGEHFAERFFTHTAQVQRFGDKAKGK